VEWIVLRATPLDANLLDEVTLLLETYRPHIVFVCASGSTPSTPNAHHLYVARTLVPDSGSSAASSATRAVWVLDHDVEQVVEEKSYFWQKGAHSPTSNQKLAFSAAVFACDERTHTIAFDVATAVSSYSVGTHCIPLLACTATHGLLFTSTFVDALLSSERLAQLCRTRLWILRLHFSNDLREVHVQTEALLRDLSKAAVGDMGWEVELRIAGTQQTSSSFVFVEAALSVCWYLRWRIIVQREFRQFGALELKSDSPFTGAILDQLPAEAQPAFNAHQPSTHSLSMLFQDAVSSSTGADLLVTLLLDSSGSIQKDWYADLKAAALTLIEKLDGAMFQLIQFSTTVDVVCQWTNDSARLKQSVSEMARLRGSTNLAEALKETRKSLYRVITKDSKPIVFLVTDGTYNGEHPQKAADELLSMKPKPYMLGIGVGRDADLKLLRSLIGNEQQVFSLGSFAELTTVVAGLKKVESSAPINLYFEPEPSRPLQRAREDLVLRYTIVPANGQPPIPKGTCLTFDKSEFFYETTLELPCDVPHSKPFSGTLRLGIIKGSADLFGDLPELLFFRVHVYGRVVKGSVKLNLAWVCADFLRNPLTDGGAAVIPVNILLWGWIGAGKTRFIDGIANLFRGSEKLLFKLVVARSDSHVTSAYTKHSVAKLLDKDSAVDQAIARRLRLNLWDAWGVSGDNYKELRLEYFLEGRVPDGFQMVDQLPSSDAAVFDRRIHAVIFVVSVHSAQAAKDLELLNKHVQIIIKRGIKPVFVINFANTLSDPEELKSCVETIKKRLGRVDDNMIFVHDNYTDVTYRNMSTDLRYRQILLTAYEQACNNIQLWYSAEACPPDGNPAITESDPGLCTQSCIACSESLPLSAKFCAMCGTSRPAYASPKCCNSKCAIEVSSDTKFCPECGTKQVVMPNACTHEVTVGAKFCHYCGVKLLS
jgi:uncharacterized protein YegL